MISQAVAKTYLDSIAKSKYPDAELEKTDTLVHTLLSRTLLSETPPRPNRNLTTSGSSTLKASEHPRDVSDFKTVATRSSSMVASLISTWLMMVASGLIQAMLNIAASWEVPVLQSGDFKYSDFRLHCWWGSSHQL